MRQLREKDPITVGLIGIVLCDPIDIPADPVVQKNNTRKQVLAALFRIQISPTKLPCYNEAQPFGYLPLF